ncbi:hypothetical protein ACNKHM_15065 [Shigella sonnei]
MFPLVAIFYQFGWKRKSDRRRGGTDDSCGGSALFPTS